MSSSSRSQLDLFPPAHPVSRHQLNLEQYAIPPDSRSLRHLPLSIDPSSGEAAHSGHVSVEMGEPMWTPS